LVQSTLCKMGTQLSSQNMGQSPAPIFCAIFIVAKRLDASRYHLVRRQASAYATLCPHPIFGPCLLWPNGWMDEDAAWYRRRLRPRPHCTRRGPSSRSPPLFGPCILSPRSAISATAELLLLNTQQTSRIVRHSDVQPRSSYTYLYCFFLQI